MAEYTDNIIKGPPSWFKNEQAPGGAKRENRPETPGRGLEKKHNVNIRLRLSAPQTGEHQANREATQEARRITDELSGMQNDGTTLGEILGPLVAKSEQTPKPLQAEKTNILKKYMQQPNVHRMRKEFMEFAKRNPRIIELWEKGMQKPKGRDSFFLSLLEAIFAFFDALSPKKQGPKDKAA
jgi:hypothetical protein